MLRRLSKPGRLAGPSWATATAGLGNGTAVGTDGATRRSAGAVDNAVPGSPSFLHSGRKLYSTRIATGTVTRFTLYGLSCCAI